MNHIRLMLSTALLSISTLAGAQRTQPPVASTPSDAQKAFTQLKSLAGSWEGTVAAGGVGNGARVQLTLRVTSRGNAIIHEMRAADQPLDPAKYDDPITMLYLDGDRLLLTHYCDAGNRPRMVAHPSPDGKSIEFSLLDVSGPLTYGHMDHVVFTFVDADHHSEDWTYMMPGDKPMHARIDLTRKSLTAQR